MKQWKQRNGKKNEVDNIGMRQATPGLQAWDKGVWSLYKELLETMKGKPLSKGMSGMRIN